MMEWKQIENKSLRVKNVKLLKLTWVNIDGNAISIYSGIRGKKKAWTVELYDLNVKSYFKEFPIQIRDTCKKEVKLFMGENAKNMAFEYVNRRISGLNGQAQNKGK